MIFLNPLRLSVAALVVTLASSVAAADAEDPAVLYQEVARQQNDSLLWGPYRPNLYFGVRPRIPKSFMGGLMWSRVDNFQDVQNSKWPCQLELQKEAYRFVPIGNWFADVNWNK
jgi:mannosyl-oligosaccharide glucosidase